MKEDSGEWSDIAVVLGTFVVDRGSSFVAVQVLDCWSSVDVDEQEVVKRRRSESEPRLPQVPSTRAI